MPPCGCLSGTLVFALLCETQGPSTPLRCGRGDRVMASLRSGGQSYCGRGSRGAAHAFKTNKEGALRFSRALREVGSFRGRPATATLVDLVFPVFVHHSGNLHGSVISSPCLR